MTEHLGDSVSRQDAKNCGGSFLSTHRIPNHHIWKPRTTTAFRKTAFRILTLFTMIRNTNGTLQSTESLLRLSSASWTAFQSNAVLTAEGLISRNQVTAETEPGDTSALTAAKHSPRWQGLYLTPIRFPYPNGSNTWCTSSSSIPFPVLPETTETQLPIVPYQQKWRKMKMDLSPTKKEKKSNDKTGINKSRKGIFRNRTNL